MLAVKEDSIIVGVAELRTKAAEVMKEVKKHNVILTKRNQPVGIILDYDEYQKIRETLDKVEDLALGLEARKRMARKGKKLLTLEEAEKRVGIR